MPFPIVWGIPKEIDQDALVMLRRGIVATLVGQMGAPAHWIRPFFPVDMLDEPDECNTIYVSLDTAMFFDKQDAETLAQKVTHALSEFIWRFFGGKYEVECFVGNLNPQWKSLIKAITEEA